LTAARRPGVKFNRPCARHPPVEDSWKRQRAAAQAAVAVAGYQAHRGQQGVRRAGRGRPGAAGSDA